MMTVEGPAMMMPAEVGQVFRVDAKTVTRWAKAGKVTCIKTIGGHRRYFRDEIIALRNGQPLSAAELAALRESLTGSRS